MSFYVLPRFARACPVVDTGESRKNLHFWSPAGVYPGPVEDLISLDIEASFAFNKNDFIALPLDSTNSKHGFAYEEPSHGSEFEQADEEESLFEVNEPWGGFILECHFQEVEK